MQEIATLKNFISNLSQYLCGLFDGKVEGWKDGKVEGWKDGKVEGWKDGKMEGWKDGRVEWRSDVVSIRSPKHLLISSLKRSC
ncbi:MAG: hypothetical protein B6D64_03865 [Bacteroidetes bacterium 4484_276]|nr:MAG: hypothetical protein B6D64_03865 [Bacteroidetes bacterium 4484_276]OYT13693.1 MAG: hypothetical protein B6I19_03815 [Bacteroidetes bacterium 4572_114]